MSSLIKIKKSINKYIRDNIQIYNINKVNIINICIIIVIAFILLYLIYLIYKYYFNNKYSEYSKYSEYTELFNGNNEHIIIPDIIGGLGNQLFLVASAFAYVKHINNDNNDNHTTQYKLMLDNRSDVFSYGKPRPTYNNTVFTKISVTTIDTKDFTRLDEGTFASRINSNSSDSSNSSNNTTSNESNKNIFLTGGYYQEAKYFNKYRNELLDLLEPTSDTKIKVNEILKANNIKLSGSGGSGGEDDFLVAIHIRLDDVYTPIDGDKRVYDTDEYDTIKKNLPEHIKQNPRTKFIIFSNDVPRTKDIFKDAKVSETKMIYIQSEDYVELALMALCHNYIASPSTFNWWGIYLNKNNSNDGSGGSGSGDKKIFIYWKQDTDYRRDFYKKYEYLKDNNIMKELINSSESESGKSGGGDKHIEKFDNYNINKLDNNKSSPFTCVSGYWKVNNKHGDSFNNWFANTLAINCPYVFFTSKDNIDNIKTFRQTYPTYFIERNITDFSTYKLDINNDTNSYNVPSKDLGLIWLEKMNLVLEASIVNPYSSEWFCWIDSGICIYRNTSPSTNIFPNPEKMNLLSKTQINYSTSNNLSNDELNSIKDWNYVHNISGTFIIHISSIKKVNDLFYKYLNMCINETQTFVCYSDQCIWTRMYLDYPNLFNKIGDGYGQIVLELL